MIPGIDAIRRQRMAPEDYERNKAQQALDDEPYLPKGDRPRENQYNA